MMHELGNGVGGIGSSEAATSTDNSQQKDRVQDLKRDGKSAIVCIRRTVD